MNTIQIFKSEGRGASGNHQNAAWRDRGYTGFYAQGTSIVKATSPNLNEMGIKIILCKCSSFVLETGDAS